jgi:hypothetical protein
VLGGDEVWAGGRKGGCISRMPCTDNGAGNGRIPCGKSDKTSRQYAALSGFGWFVSGRCQIISQCQDPAAAAAQEEEYLCKHKIL